MLSTVQFDSSGEYLATGDRGGRVVIFRKTDDGKAKVGPHILSYNPHRAGKIVSATRYC